MSQGGEAAEQMTKVTLEISEESIKLMGAGAKNLTVFLLAIAKDNEKLKGKTNLNTMLKDGRVVQLFPITEEYLKDFAKEAKKYGILFTVVKNKKTDPPSLDVMARTEDVSKINRVFEIIGYPIPMTEENRKKLESRQVQKKKSSVRESILTAEKMNTTEKTAVQKKKGKKKNKKKSKAGKER